MNDRDTGGTEKEIIFKNELQDWGRVIIAKNVSDTH